MKKCIAILTCFMLLTGIALVQLPLTAAAFADIEGLPCKEEVELLAALGVVEGMSEDTFAPEETLTRAEASAIICRLIGTSDFVINEDMFSDVPFDHWAYNNIGTLAQLGIVNGVSDGVFAPEETLSYQQTVKLIVEALGYHVKAESAGGYPAGYMATASVLGVLRGTAPNDDGTISRGNMAIMAANALTCEVLVRTAYGDAHAFVEQENASILHTYLHVSEEKGRITATYDARLSNTVRPEKDEIVMDHSAVYKIGESHAAEFVGQNVTIYAKQIENDELKTILHVVPHAASERYDFSASDLRLEQNRIITEDDTNFVLNDETVYVYNGRKCTDAFSLPTEGNVSFVCDRDNDIQVIFVSEYKSYVIKTALVDTSAVYFKDVAEGESSELIIDIEDSAKVTRLLDTTGKAVAFSKLQADDVLTVMESKDQTALTVIVSNQKVNGTVTEIQNNGAEVVIGEETYKVSPSLYKNTNAVRPELSKESTFLLDAFGNIAAVAEEKERTQKYGYLLSASYTRGLEKRAQLKIYTEEGKMVVFDTADTITLKTGLTETAKTTETLLDETGILQLSGEKLTVKEQLVMYETNAEGKLHFIELAIGDGTRIETFSGDAKTEEQEKRNLSLSYDADLPSSTYYGGVLRLYAGYVIPEDCVIFNLPAKVGDEPLPTNEKLYSIISAKKLIHNGPELKNGGKMYDIEEDKSVGAIIIQLEKKDTGTEMIDTAPVAIIKEVVTRLDDDGNTGVGIKAVTAAGKDVDLFCPEDMDIEFGIKGDTKTTSTVIADINKETETEMENGVKVFKDYIKLTDLNPGDLIAYEEFGGEIQKAAVRFRAQAPAVREFGTYNGKHALLQSKDYFSVLNSYCGNVFWFNEVEEKTEDERLLVTFPVLRYEAKYPDVTEWKRSEPIGTAKIYSFDMKTGKLEKSSADAIMEGSKVLYYRSNLVPKLIVIYKNMPGVIPPFAADLVPNK